MRALRYHVARNQIESARLYVAHYRDGANSHDTRGALRRLRLDELRAIAPAYAQRADSTREDCIVAILTCAYAVAQLQRDAINRDCAKFDTRNAIAYIFNA